MPRYTNTERVGVNAVERFFVKDLGWIFREQLIADMGIDAQVELVEAKPTGQLVGVQIKTGSSHFHKTPKGLVYYGSQAHLDYWLGHRLPVLLIAHLPDSEETYWVQVQEKSVRRTEKHWKILIPYSNFLDASSRAKLQATFKGSKRDQLLRRLTLDERLMRYVRNEDRVSVDMEDWHVSGRGRTLIRVVVYGDDGGEKVVKKWDFRYVGYGQKELIKTIFPWAITRIDEQFYNEYEELEDTDPDLKRVELEPNEVYPYKDLPGEVTSYRLQLFLTDFGKAYLQVSDHLNDMD